MIAAQDNDFSVSTIRSRNLCKHLLLMSLQMLKTNIRRRRATAVGFAGATGGIFVAIALFTPAFAYADQPLPAGPTDTDTLGGLNAYEFGMFDKVLNGNIRDDTAVFQQEGIQLQQLAETDMHYFGLADQALMDGNISSADSYIGDALTADMSTMQQGASAVESIAAECLSNTFGALNPELGAITNFAPDIFGAI
jgi:hypothetical protein